MSAKTRPKRYPFPAWGIDRTDSVKRRTPEFFVFNEGWRTAERFRREPRLDTWEDILPLSRAGADPTLDGIRVHPRLVGRTKSAVGVGQRSIPDDLAAVAWSGTALCEGPARGRD